MVDVGGKPLRAGRRAARVRMAPRNRRVAQRPSEGRRARDGELAGIMAAKRTSDLIPLCHPLPLTHVNVVLEVREGVVEIEASASTTAQTGVEMEALVAASVAALTLYDMAKAVDKQMVIEEIRLVEKTKEIGVKAAVLTVSDGVTAGVRDDASGDVLEELLRADGFVVERRVVSDDAPLIAAALGARRLRGVARTDNRRHRIRSARRHPRGDADGNRSRSARPCRGDTRGRDRPDVACAALARGGGTPREHARRESPGSPGGCRDGFAVIQPALRHGLELAAGDTTTPTARRDGRDGSASTTARVARAHRAHGVRAAVRVRRRFPRGRRLARPREPRVGHGRDDRCANARHVGQPARRRRARCAESTNSESRAPVGRAVARAGGRSLPGIARGVSPRRLAARPDRPMALADPRRALRRLPVPEAGHVAVPSLARRVSWARAGRCVAGRLGDGAVGSLGDRLRRRVVGGRIRSLLLALRPRP